MNHDEKKDGGVDHQTRMAGKLIVNPKFPLGRLVITSNAESTLSANDVQLGLQRHASADWGILCKGDWLENELSLRKGYRLLSAYDTSDGTRFWIITEWDRSATTVLLPEDY